MRAKSDRNGSHSESRCAQNSAGSQFYITLAPQPALYSGYTVFGQVVEGMDVVMKIKKGDIMTKVTVVEATR
ncbi:peptidylprolyl isomerase [Candidatus Methylomirabilis limnetica]|uniref:peptidylprolyl isomerase n=1 Tax=Candidatus Methylomirabilis limnetica TaxID=2033718 RepID=UPI000D1F18F9|nr:peptidylprolyl isomerase [Candidatus Methylomirabilis limnetica]